MTRHVNLNEAIQVKTALKVLSPGMYIVRYIGTRPSGSVEANVKHSANIPLALSQAPIDMSGEIEFICPEGISHQTLSAPGDYLLVHVKRGEAVLAASKYSPKALEGQVDLHWRMEPLNQPKAAETPLRSAKGSAQQPASEPLVSEPLAPETLAVTGHIERRGDVTVKAGEWLGDPAGQARLEGFQVQWTPSSGKVELLGACRAGQKNLQAKAPDFLGTRKQAAAITQLALCLAGSDAEHYRLQAEAAFSDGSRHVLGEKQAVQASSSGAHLVAVKVTVAPGIIKQTAKNVEPPTRSSWLDPENTVISKA